MAKRICSVVENGEQCLRFTHARGFCAAHYMAWWKYGDPLARPGLRGPDERLHAGYRLLRREGHVLANRRGWVLEHRLVAFEAGMLRRLDDHVHHRDGNKLNNARDNLEVMSNAEHARLHAFEPGSIQSTKRAQTHCIHGHEFTPENTYVTTRGLRQCIACRTIRKRRYAKARR